MQNFVEIGKIGEGAFGEIIRAKDLRSMEVVAMKKIFIPHAQSGLPLTVWREIKTMQVSDHPNIVRFIEWFPHGSTVVIVMECMTYSLADIIGRTREKFPESVIKYFSFGLLSGLAYLHSLDLIHRDVKPANLLMNSDGAVKLGDFGLARLVAIPPRTFSHQAATRWYRAPESLYAARTYGPEVDMWAAGCVIAELWTLSPLFPGETDIDQLQRIFAIMGTPDSWLEDWPKAAELPDFDKVSFGPMPEQSLEGVIPGVTEEAANLVGSLLTVPPHHRLPASSALDHAWFQQAPLAAAPALMSESESGAKARFKRSTAEELEQLLSAAGY